MGDDVKKTLVITSATVNLYRASDPNDAVCIQAAYLLKEHLLEVGLDRPTTMGIETEYGQYDTTIQKAYIRLETLVEK